MSKTKPYTLDDVEAPHQFVAWHRVRATVVALEAERARAEKAEARATARKKVAQSAKKRSATNYEEGQ